MISYDELVNKSKQWGLQDNILEKDYALGWLLWGIAKHPILSQEWVLKGGACIKKCYVDTHRYSQDLDFTVLPSGTWQPSDLIPIFEQILKDVTQASGIDFTTEQPRFEERPHGGSTEGKIYFIGPRKNPNPTAIKLDITQDEDLMSRPVLRPISHPYSDMLPDTVYVRCYALEELFAEKLRAFFERHRPHDLYDVVYLFRRSDLHVEPDLIYEVLEAKCDFKGIAVPDFATVNTPEVQKELQERWGTWFTRSLGFIPEFETYWIGLEALFAWLKGQDYTVELESISSDDAWEAPAIEWQKGQSEWLEPIRFAAVNQLRVILGYGGSTRIVEPYSLRSSRVSAILFYAWNTEKGQIRAYSVDQLESIEVIRKPYTPRFPVEFTPKGRVSAPLVRRRRRFISSGKNRSSRKYVIECSVCGKRFYREKYSLRISSHKRKGSSLPCSGRHGYMV